MSGEVNAYKVALLQRLKALVEAERNPDVKRGLAMAIYEIKREVGE
jgi:hypothetical protein